MTEAQEQRAVIEYCDWRKLPIFHIPNGGKRDLHTAQHLKQQGVKAGVPDLCLPIPSNSYHGLYIEMKRADGGRVTEHQQRWLDLLNSYGYRAVVCHGSQEAIDTIESYLA